MIWRKVCTKVENQDRFLNAVRENKIAIISVLKYFPLTKDECYVEQHSYIKNTLNKCKDCIGHGVDIDMIPCNECIEFSKFTKKN